MNMSLARCLLATLLLLGCGSTERGEANPPSVTPGARGEASPPSVTPCPDRSEGTRDWTCKGPVPSHPRDGGRRDGCAHAEGVGSIQVDAMINALHDCAEQLGIDCGRNSPSLDLGGLRCVSKRAPELIL